MNKAPLSLSSSIRTNSSDKLLRTISLPGMYTELIDLFVDRTAKDTSINGFANDEKINEFLKYSHCLSLNDERTIKFNQGWKQEDDVFDEKLQIWISKFIDTEKDNMFVPRVDAH
ncbi:hypothetical protein IKD48_03055 [bacterium]|nr:hypothetical protein [bacterium]